MSSETVHFDPSRLLHSSYDLASQNPQGYIQAQNAVIDFINLVRKKQASTNQIDDFIAFVDHDQTLEVSRPMITEFRYHPSESDKGTSYNGEHACPNSQNPGMIRILQALAHRLPPTPGAECPMTESHKAFLEKYKPEFDAMRAGEEEMLEGFRGDCSFQTTRQKHSSPADLMLRSSTCCRRRGCGGCGTGGKPW